MKKIMHFLNSILYITVIVFIVRDIFNKYSDIYLIMVSLSILIHVFYIFSYICPKLLFDACWKLTKYLPENYDYDTNYANIGKVRIGLMISSYLFLLVSLIFFFN